MEEIQRQLEQFSNEHKLWEITLASGRTSLANHFIDEPEECARLFEAKKAGDVRFVPWKQQLMFKRGSESVFIVSTFYTLGIDDHNGNNVVYGYYVLDVDRKAEPADDSLVFY